MSKKIANLVRLSWTCILFAAFVLVLASGCGDPNYSSPTLAELEQGQVSVFRTEPRSDSDVFLVSYAVKAPLETVWEATEGIPDWFLSAGPILEVEPLRESEEKSLYRIRWKDNVAQVVELQRDLAKRQIEMSFDSSGRSIGSPGECTILMRPFLGDSSTLVQAEIRLENDFAGRLVDLLAAPIGILKLLDQEVELTKLWTRVAESHRQASEQMAQGVAQPTLRTHIIAIGVNRNGEGGPWPTLQFAEKDAKEFFDLCEALYGRPRDDQVIRELIVGPDATDDRIGKVMTKLEKERCIVKSGDSVILFYAGHIDREEDALGQGRNLAYLITARAAKDNLRWTGFPRDGAVDYLQKSLAGKCLFICDACYSGGHRTNRLSQIEGVRSRGPVPLDSAIKTPEKVVCLAASTDIAVESDTLKHGVFTYWILEGLRGKADSNKDRVLTLVELEEFVEDSVSKYTQERQTPYFHYGSKSQLDEWQWSIP